MQVLLAVIWWILLILAAWGLAVGITFATPQELAMLIGFAGFMLLAGKLLFGYGGLLTFLEAATRGEEPDRSLAEAAVRLPDPEKLSLAALAGFWLAALDPYRYAFYAVYLLLLLITLATKLVLPLPDMWAWVTGSSLIEGVFWGASIVALLVWALGAAASVLTVKLATPAEQASA
ncbi:hypothetical protein [Oceanithermus sp.]